MKILIMGDTHCGGKTGLTPPKFDRSGITSRDKRLFDRRRELWELYSGVCETEGPFDFVIHGGDTIQGRKHGAGTDNLLEQEISQQIEIAKRVLRETQSENGLIVLGTASHVGEDFTPVEQIIADSLGWTFRIIAEDLNLGGVIFHVKHKIGGSNDPRYLGNMLNKEMDTIRANHHENGVPAVLPDVLLRFHRHVFRHIESAGWDGYICPCLQVWGDNYAAEMTANYYPMQGVLICEIDENDWEIRPILWRLETQGQ